MPCGPEAPARVVLVLSNRPDAGGLERARAHGVAAEVLPDPADAADWLARLDASPDRPAGPRRLPQAGARPRRRPLPPSDRERAPGAAARLRRAAGMYGRHVHEAVLASGARESGATVHLVDEVYDRGADPRPGPGARAAGRHARAPGGARARGRAPAAAGRGAGRRRRRAAPFRFPKPWSPPS